MDGTYAYTTFGGPLFAPLPGRALEPAEAERQLHWKVTIEAGRVSEAVEYGLLGRRATKHVYDYADDGTLRTIQTLNAHDVVLTTHEFDAARRTFMVRHRMGRVIDVGCHARTYAWDRATATATLGCLDLNFAPKLDELGASTRKYTYDQVSGSLRSEELLDAEGQRVDGSLGWALAVDTRDEHGRLLGHKALDRADVPVREYPYFCDEYQYSVDAAGLRTSFACLAASGTKIPDADGIPEHRYSYDERGCETRDRYYDAKGKPLLLPDGMVGLDRVPNAHCETVESFFVAPREQVLADFPVTVHQYDDRGDLLSTTYYDSQRIPAGSGSCGAHIYAYLRDERGLSVETSMFGFDGRPMNCNDNPRGWSVTRHERDGAGNILRTTLLNADGRPPPGFHTIEYGYDQAGFVVLKKSISEADVVVQKTVRDAATRRRTLSYFDANDRAIDASLGVAGVDDPEVPYHRVELIYDDLGHHTHDIYYDVAGQQIMKVDCLLQRCQDMV